MAQNYIGQITDTSTESGDDLANRLNDFDNAHRTNQSGATRPAGALAGAIWTRVAAGVYDLMMFNGTKDVAVLTGDGNLAGLTDKDSARGNIGLGTAATVDHGTGPGEVPLNSDLGSMATETAADYVTKASKATKSQAEGGTTGDVWMDDVRVRQAIAKWAIGVGQTWVDVTANRVATNPYTKYQNTTGRTIMVVAKIGATGTFGFSVSPTAVGAGVLVTVGDTAAWMPHVFVVPPGHYYWCNINPTRTVERWVELR